MNRRAPLLLVLCLLAAAPPTALATQPGRSGILAMPFNDNEDNGSSTGGHPYPIRHGYLAWPPAGGAPRPVAWCAHRWREPSPCARFGEIEFAPGGAELADAGVTLRVRRADGVLLRTLSTLYTRSPSWSPDASRIAFVAHGDVFTIRADGGDLRRLTRTETGGSGGTVDSVSWSADGRLAMTLTNSARVTVATATSDGRGVRVVLRLRVVDGGRAPTADWSPDGRRILVSAGGRVLLANARGRRHARVLARGGWGARMSPDGRRIAYFVPGPGLDDRVALARADGRGRRVVTLGDPETGYDEAEFSREHGPLTWQPLR